MKAGRQLQQGQPGRLIGDRRNADHTARSPDPRNRRMQPPQPCVRTPKRAGERGGRERSGVPQESAPIRRTAQTIDPLADAARRAIKQTPERRGESSRSSFRSWLREPRRSPQYSPRAYRRTVANRYLYVQQPHTAEADRRTDTHRLDQLRIRAHFIVADPFAPTGVAVAINASRPSCTCCLSSRSVIAKSRRA